MTIFKKLTYHYFVGVLITSSIILLIILFDYFFNGYFQYPELQNFLKVSFLGGLGFGLTHFVSFGFPKRDYESLNLKLVLLFEYFYFEKNKNIPYDQLTLTEKKIISRDDYNTIISSIKKNKK